VITMSKVDSPETFIKSLNKHVTPKNSACNLTETDWGFMYQFKNMWCAVVNRIDGGVVEHVDIDPDSFDPKSDKDVLHADNLKELSKCIIEDCNA
jgi:hypothetical protein